MSSRVRELIKQVESLNQAERRAFERELARRADAEWQDMAVQARRQAAKDGIDDATINRALADLRYSRKPRKA